MWKLTAGTMRARSQASDRGRHWCDLPQPPPSGREKISASRDHSGLQRGRVGIAARHHPAIGARQLSGYRRIMTQSKISWVRMERCC